MRVDLDAEEPAPSTVDLPPGQLIVRLLPLVCIAWTRTYAVVLPGMMVTFSLTPGQGGALIAAIEGSSFISLVLLSFLIQRIGASRTLLWAMPVTTLCLFAIAWLPAVAPLTPFLVLLGAGMAWTATGINTLMAATGARRAFYLGVMHSVFSACSVIAPLIASQVIEISSWQTWYRMVCGLNLVFFGFFCWSEFGSNTAHPIRGQDTPHGPTTPAKGSLSSPFLSIAGICLGAYCLTSVQGILNSWSFLYFADQYSDSAETAVFAPACFWSGVLLGRTALIPLARQFSAQGLLIVLSLLPVSAMAIEQGLSNPLVALASMLVVGVGVSGAFQLGTQWAVEKLPHAVGLASTSVMAFAWLGIGTSPWFAGLLIEASSYAQLFWLVAAGSLGACLAFWCSAPASDRNQERGA